MREGRGGDQAIGIGDRGRGHQTTGIHGAAKSPGTGLAVYCLLLVRVCGIGIQRTGYRRKIVAQFVAHRAVLAQLLDVIHDAPVTVVELHTGCIGTADLGKNRCGETALDAIESSAHQHLAGERKIEIDGVGLVPNETVSSRTRRITGSSIGDAVEQRHGLKHLPRHHLYLNKCIKEVQGTPQGVGNGAYGQIIRIDITDGADIPVRISDLVWTHHKFVKEIVGDDGKGLVQGLGSILIGDNDIFRRAIIGAKTY